MIPLRIVTDWDVLDGKWLDRIIRLASKPVAVIAPFDVPCSRLPFMTPYYSDFGNLSLFITAEVEIDCDVYQFITQAKTDKFRAVYLLDGKQDVMLFRNKYCERLTPEYVMSAPIEELQSLAWAGKKENVGCLSMSTAVQSAT